ncbi:hypothetical protein [Saccharopolyspora elongata]|uniref:hypothetical protein n=1 Tax=Saccharopolyspora elongata TaxID=2530387 RepID=UPI0010484AAF|nr:hypothetical protein [Saccharopolyspora elongata]
MQVRGRDPTAQHQIWHLSVESDPLRQPAPGLELESSAAVVHDYESAAGKPGQPGSPSLALATLIESAFVQDDIG